MSDSSDQDSTTASLQSITRGASLHLVGQVLANGFKFVLQLLLTRGLGATRYGIYAYAWTLLTFVTIFARLGTGKSLLRFIPAYEDDPSQRNRVVGLAYLTAFVGSIAAGIALYVLAPSISAYTLENPLLVDVLRIFALVLPFNTALNLTYSVFRALEQLEYQVLLADIVEPAAQVIVVAIALFVGFSLLGIVAALALVTVLICFAGFVLMYGRTRLEPSATVRHSPGQLREFYNYSVPLTLKDVGRYLYTRVDILMVGFFLAEAAVGIYRMSFVIAGFLTLALTGVEQLFPSVASRLYSNDEMAELETIYRTVTRWTLTIAIPPALVAFLYSAEVLAIFGPEFTAGALVLTLATLGQLSYCAVGPAGYLLMMTDHQYLVMTNQWILGILNVVANYVFILEFGLIGAALATASVLVLVNLLRLVEVWYTEGLTPYSVGFWKPITAGTIAGTCMYAASLVLEGYVLLVAGSMIGGVVFVASIFAFGIEREDREFFEEAVL